MRFTWFVLAVLCGLTSCHTGSEDTSNSIDEPDTLLSASADPTTFLITTVVTDQIIPWDLVWDETKQQLWFTEKEGQINRFDPQSGELLEVHRIDDVFVSTIENSGLHALCLHPDWPDSSYFYAHYTYDSLASRLVRYHFDQDQDTVVGSTVVFDAVPGARSHNGSRLQIGPDNMIYWSVGDAYLFDPAQDPTSLNGKINRFHPDGSIPADNPVPGSYLWTRGHRNPQGLVWASNGKLYASEHGTSDDDELNLLKPGGNYGWPGVSGYVDLPIEEKFAVDKELNEPLITWSPTRAPSGLSYYDHDAIPEWKNCLLQVFLKDRSLGVLSLNAAGDQVTDHHDYFAVGFLRLRDVEVLPDGSLYLSTSNRERIDVPHLPHDDKIFHIQAVSDALAGADELPSISLDEEGRVLIETKKPEDTLVVNYTRFYHLSEYSDTLAGANSYTIPWRATDAQPYFVKLELPDGRLMMRRIVWK